MASALDRALAELYGSGAGGTFAGGGFGAGNDPGGIADDYLADYKSRRGKKKEGGKRGFLGGNILEDVFELAVTPATAVMASAATAGRTVGALAGKDYGENGPSAQNWWDMVFTPDERIVGEDIISGNPEKGFTYGVFKGENAPAGSLFDVSPHPAVRALSGFGLEAAVDPLNFVLPAGKVHGAKDIASHITDEFAKQVVAKSGREVTPELAKQLIKGEAQFNDILALPAGHELGIEVAQMRDRAAAAVQAARRGGVNALTPAEIEEFGGGALKKGLVLDFGRAGKVQLTRGGGPLQVSQWRNRAQMALGDALLSKGGKPVRFGKYIANAGVEARARSATNPIEMMDATVARRLRRTMRFMDEAKTNEAANAVTQKLREAIEETGVPKEELDDLIDDASLIIDGGLDPADADPRAVTVAQKISDSQYTHAQMRVEGGAAAEDTLMQRGTYFPSPITNEGRELMTILGFHPEEEASRGNALFINQRRKLYDAESKTAGFGLDGETTRRISKEGVESRAEAEKWFGEEVGRELKAKIEAGDQKAIEWAGEHPEFLKSVDEGDVQMFKTGREALVAGARATGRSIARARAGRRLFEMGYGIVDPRATEGFVNYGPRPEAVEQLERYGQNQLEREQDLLDAQRDAESAAREFQAAGGDVATPGDLEDPLRRSLGGEEPPEGPPGGTPAPPPEPRGPAPAGGTQKTVIDRPPATSEEKIARTVEARRRLQERVNQAHAQSGRPGQPPNVNTPEGRRAAYDLLGDEARLDLEAAGQSVPSDSDLVGVGVPEMDIEGAAPRTQASLERLREAVNLDARPTPRGHQPLDPAYLDSPQFPLDIDRMIQFVEMHPNVTPAERAVLDEIIKLRREFMFYPTDLSELQQATGAFEHMTSGAANRSQDLLPMLEDMVTERLKWAPSEGARRFNRLVDKYGTHEVGPGIANLVDQGVPLDADEVEELLDAIRAFPEGRAQAIYDEAVRKGLIPASSESPLEGVLSDFAPSTPLGASQLEELNLEDAGGAIDDLMDEGDIEAAVELAKQTGRYRGTNRPGEGFAHIDAGRAVDEAMVDEPVQALDELAEATPTAETLTPYEQARAEGRPATMEELMASGEPEPIFQNVAKQTAENTAHAEKVLPPVQPGFKRVYNHRPLTGEGNASDWFGEAQYVMRRGATSEMRYVDIPEAQWNKMLETAERPTAGDVGVNLAGTKWVDAAKGIPDEAPLAQAAKAATDTTRVDRLDRALLYNGWQAKGDLPATAKRVVVTGGRTETHPEQARAIIDWLKAEYGDDIVVIHGVAKGADQTFGDAATAAGLTVEEFPADWKGLGNKAGPIRNKQMVDAGPDLAIAFPGGKGTANMKRQLGKAQIPTVEVGPLPRGGELPLGLSQPDAQIIERASAGEKALAATQRAELDARVAADIDKTHAAYQRAKELLAEGKALRKDDWKEATLAVHRTELKRLAEDLGITSDGDIIDTVKAAVTEYEKNPELHAVQVRARIEGAALEEVEKAKYGLEVAGKTERKRIRERTPWSPQEKAEHRALKETIERNERLRRDSYNEVREITREIKEIGARGPQPISASNERLERKIARWEKERDELERGLAFKESEDVEAARYEAEYKERERPTGGPEDIARTMGEYFERNATPTEGDIFTEYSKRRFKSTPDPTMTDKAAREATQARIDALAQRIGEERERLLTHPESTVVTDMEHAYARLNRALDRQTEYTKIIEDAKAKKPGKWEKYGKREFRWVDQPVEGSPMFVAQQEFEETIRAAEAKQLAEPLPEKSERFVPGQSPLRDFETNELVPGFEGTRTASAEKVNARTLDAHAKRIHEQFKNVAATASTHEYLRDAFARYRQLLDEGVPPSAARDLIALADSQVDRAGMLANDVSQVDAMVDDIVHEAEVVGYGELEGEGPTALYENVGSGGPRGPRPPRPPKTGGTPEGIPLPEPTPQPTRGPLYGPPTPRAIPRAYIEVAERRATDAKAWQKVHQGALEAGDTVMAETARLRIMASRLANDADLAHANAKSALTEWNKIHSMWTEASKHGTLLQKGVADFATHRVMAPGLLAPEDMVNDILAVDRMFNDPATQTKFGDAWRKMLHWMRVWQITSPGFHVRNAFGGVFNNALHDTDAVSYTQFQNLWGKARKGAEMTPEQLKMWNDVTSIVSISSGQVGSEAFGSPLGQLAGTDALAPSVIGKVVGSKGVLPRASENVASNVEFMLRGTLAFDVMKKGGSLDDAAEAVAKFHFDYHDASRSEQWLKANAVPFLTWTRHNLPLQLEMMIEHPKTYARFAEFRDNMEATSEQDPVVPAYFSEISAMRLPWMKGGGHNYYIPDLPFRDIGLAAGPIDALTSNEGDVGDRALSAFGEPVSQLTPLISGPIEWALGKQFYKGIPLRNDKGIATKDLHIPDWLSRPLSMTPFIKHSKNGYYITEHDFYILEKELPILARIRRLGGSSEQKQQDKLMSRMISFFGGTQIRTNTEEDQKIANYLASLETKRRNTIERNMG